MNVRKKTPAGILLTVMLLAALLTICLELGLSYLRPDTPGSIPKHLIHFAIMFALLGGAVLLCLFCPPFKKLWAWIDEHILTQETRPIAIDIIYAVIAGLMLLHHFYVIIFYPTLTAGAVRFAPVWILFAALTILLGKSWRELSFRIAAVSLLFAFERYYIIKLTVTGNTAVYFASAIYSLLICLGIFSTIRTSLWKPFLKTLCVLWSVATLILSVLGLYTAWTAIPFYNLGGGATQVERGRLWVFSYSTITATYFGCGSIMTLIGFVVTKHKLLKLLFLFNFIIAMIANSLTDARASFFAVAFMLSGTICISIWTLYKNKMENTSKRKTILVIATLIICFATCFYGTIEGQRYLGTGFIQIRNNGGIIPVAKSEASETHITQELSETPEPDTSIIPPTFTQRNVWLSEDTDPNNIFTNRLQLWQRAFEHIESNPFYILFGLSIDGNQIIEVVKDYHSHNIFIQILLEGGTPALLLYLSLVFYSVFHAFRLWNNKGIPFWQRLLPLPVFSILLWEMVECLTHFSYGHPPMTLFWFFLGATIAVSKSLGKNPKEKEIPTTIHATETGE